MALGIDAVVAESIHPHLLRQVHLGIEVATARIAREQARLIPSSQSRQALGLLRRSEIIGQIIEPAARYGARPVTVTPDLDAIAIHGTVVSVDLLEVGRVLLWLTRVDRMGNFAVAPSATIRRFASSLGTVRPLFNEPNGPVLLALFYELDSTREHVIRVGVGLPSSSFSAIGLDIISDGLAYAAQFDLRQATELDAVNRGDVRHQLGFRTIDDTILDSTDMPEDAGEQLN